jgi:hypothetical protein
MLEQKTEAFSQEEKENARELYYLMVDAYSRVLIPFVAINREKVKEDLIKAKEKLEKLI